jgi:hypothetical protein
MSMFHTVTTFEVRTARAVFEAIFPSNQSKRLPNGIADGDIEAYMQDITEAWQVLPVLTLRAALWMVAISAIFLAPSLRPFYTLPESTRLKVLNKLYTSDNYFVRQLVVMLKAVGGLLYGAMLRPTMAPSIAPEKSEALILLRSKKPVTHDTNSVESV